MRISLSLALAQVRHRFARWALLGAGIALVVAVPVITAGLGRSVSAQTVRATVARLDVADRSLLVSVEASTSESARTAARDDRIVRGQLRRLSVVPTLRELLYRELTVRGQSFLLAGVDGLAGAVRLTGGRLPRTCAPTRCEVLALDPASGASVAGGPGGPGGAGDGGAGDSAALRAAARTLGVVVVGTARRTNPLLVSGPLDPGTTPQLLANGASGIASLRALALFSRHYAWVSATDADRVVALGVKTYLRTDEDVAATLDRRVGSTSFARPDDELAVAQRRADTSARRLGLLGGFAAVLLVGFAVVGAVGLRRETAVLGAVLRRRGATDAQVVLVAVAAVALVAVTGLLVGAVGGGAVAAAASDGTGDSAFADGVHALGGSWLPVLVLTLVTAATTVAVLLWPDARAPAVWRVLDVLAVACLGAALLAGDRGNARAGDLASAGDPLVVALPVLAAVIAGLVAARIWGPAAGVAQRLLPRRSVAGRIALSGVLRRPLRPVSTVAFLTAAVASVVFAGAYRATLLANDADQAAYRVPLDATMRASPADPTPVASSGGGVTSHPVLRTNASVTRLAGVADSVPVVAVDAVAVARVHRWAQTTGGDVSAGPLAGRLALPAPTLPALPAGARTLSIAATGADPRTVISVWVTSADEEETQVVLTARGGQLVGSLPTGRGRLSVSALGVAEDFGYASRRAHNLGEGHSDQPALTGRLTLGAVAIDGTAIRWSWTGWGAAHGTVTAASGSLRLAYRLRNALIAAVPDFAAVRARTVPVAVDPTTAATARGGLLPLVIDASTTITARVVATLPRLPTAGDRFVLADLSALRPSLNLYSPGRNATEFWLSGSSGALSRYLAGSAAQVRVRSAVQDGLDRDPIGRGARNLLVLVALVSLAVGAVALVLLVLGERRDGAGELYSWEADGLAPSLLRRMLAVRLAAVAVVAVPVGVLAGVLLARVATTLVAVDATGTTPTPPLAATVGSGWTSLVLAGGIGAGLLAGVFVIVASLRERFPVPAEAELR